MLTALLLLSLANLVLAVPMLLIFAAAYYIWRYNIKVNVTCDKPPHQPYATLRLGVPVLALALALLLPSLAHAQALVITSAVTGTKYVFDLLGVLATTGVVAGFFALLGKHLSDKRKSQVATAAHVALKGLELAERVVPAGTAAADLANVDKALTAADTYMESRGWDALKPAEAADVQQHLNAAKVALLPATPATPAKIEQALSKVLADNAGAVPLAVEGGKVVSQVVAQAAQVASKIENKIESEIRAART